MQSLAGVGYITQVVYYDIFIMLHEKLNDAGLWKLGYFIVCFWPCM